MRQRRSAECVVTYDKEHRPFDLYVGTFTQRHPGMSAEPALGVEHLVYDPRSRHVESRDVTLGSASPAYMRMHPSLPVLYAAEFSTPGGLGIYRVLADRSLQYCGTVGSIGDLAVAVDVHPSGGYAYVANWGSGGVTAYRLDNDGVPREGEALTPCTTRNVTDSATWRPHEVRPAPSGGAVLVPYTGLDVLVVYSTDDDGAVSGPPVREIAFPPGSGPRHLEFHPSGRWLYVVGERDSTLYVLAADAGVPSSIRSSVPTLRPDVDQPNEISEIAVHPRGDALYVGNRGANSIATFSANDDGSVELVGQQPCLGWGPRALTIDEAGSTLAVADYESGEIELFAVRQDRSLTPLADPTRSHAPSSLVILTARQETPPVP